MSKTAPAPAAPAREVKLTPIGDRILLAVEWREQVGRVRISRDALAKELRLCVILAIGPKVALTHPMLQPGSVVWLKPFFGVEAIVNGNTVLFARPDNIVGRASSGTECMTMYRILKGPTEFVTVEPLYRTNSGAAFAGARVICDDLAAARASIDQKEFTRLDRTDSDDEELIERWL